MDAVNCLGGQVQSRLFRNPYTVNTSEKCPGCGRFGSEKNRLRPSETVEIKGRNGSGKKWFTGKVSLPNIAATIASAPIKSPIFASQIITSVRSRNDLIPTSSWWYQIAGSGGARLNKKNIDYDGENVERFFQSGGQVNGNQLHRINRWRRNCRLYPGSVEESVSFNNRSSYETEAKLLQSGALADVLLSSPPHPEFGSYPEDSIHSQARSLHDKKEVLREVSGEVHRDRTPGRDSEDEEIQVQQVEFPTLQVQSREEQEKLAATPAHPKALHAMNASYFASCFIEKIWRFALPAILALLHDSLLPVAVVSFVGQHAWRFICPAVLSLLHHSLLPVAVASFTGQLVIFAAGPWVGEMMDRAPRVLAFNVLSITQAAAMLVSAGVTLHALQSGVSASSSAMTLFTKPWFVVLVIAGAVEKMTGLASGVAFERDWVVQLAGANRPLALAKANASVRRVDLICEISGPLIFGWLLSKYPSVHCVKIAIVVMLISLPILLSLVKLTDTFSSGVLQRPRHSRSLSTVPQGEEKEPKVDVPGGFSAASKGWRQYIAQPVLPASIAYVLLYFNAVLSPGGLMTSFLTQRGLDVSIIGMFRGACAAMGFLATFLSAPLIARLGVLKAGGAALAFQAFVLFASILVYLVTPPGNYAGLLVFLSCVVLSRLGQWTYDVVDAQIFQTAIPASQANLVGTTEIALASLAELIMLAVAIVVHDVNHFGSLAFISMLSVMGAATIYWRWLLKPTADQKRLFPNEPHFRLGLESIEPGLQPLVPPMALLMDSY